MAFRILKKLKVCLVKGGGLGMLSRRDKIKNILNIAVPSGLQMCLDVVTLFCALFFLSNISLLHFTALSLGSNYILIFYPLSAVFGIGANVLMSHRYGIKAYDDMNLAFSTMFHSALVLSLPVLLVAYLGIAFYLRELHLEGELYDLSFYYVGLTIFAIPAIMLKTVISSGFAATGNTRRPFYVKIAMTALSILGYAILVEGRLGIEGLGLFGAALVSLVVSYLELACLYLLIRFSKTKLRLALAFRWGLLKKGLRIAVPTGLERIFSLVALNVVLIFVAKYTLVYGDSALSGFQSGAKIESLSFIPGFGFMIAIMSLMGHCLATKDYKLAKDYASLCCLLSSILLGVLGLLLALLAEPLSLLFITNDQSALEISISYLVIIGLSQIPLILSFVYDGALRGAGWTHIPLFVNITSISLFRLLPMYIASSSGWHLYSLFVIMFVETYIRAMIFYFIFRSGIWQKSRNILEST